MKGFMSLGTRDSNNLATTRANTTHQAIAFMSDRYTCMRTILQDCFHGVPSPALCEGVLELSQGATFVGACSHPVRSHVLPKLQAARARVLVPT